MILVLELVFTNTDKRTHQQSMHVGKTFFFSIIQGLFVSSFLLPQCEDVLMYDRRLKGLGHAILGNSALIKWS